MVRGAGRHVSGARGVHEVEVTRLTGTVVRFACSGGDPMGIVSLAGAKLDGRRLRACASEVVHEQ
jgi:hypothetical protein